MEKQLKVPTAPSESELSLRIGYLIDTNHGYCDQPLAEPDNAADTLDAMIEEGVLAEQCAIIDNISRGRLHMTWGQGFHAGYWGQFGVPPARTLGRCEATREQVQRFGEEVAQPLHRKYPAPDHPAIPKTCRW